MSVGHYENFPVASFLVPPRERRAVVAIYRFARAADDLADEGDDAPQLRLDALARFRRAVDAIAGPMMDFMRRVEKERNEAFATKVTPGCCGSQIQQ